MCVTDLRGNMAEQQDSRLKRPEDQTVSSPGMVPHRRRGRRRSSHPLRARRPGKDTRQRSFPSTPQAGKEAVADTTSDIVESGKEMFERGRQIVDDAAALFDRGRRMVRGD